MAPKVSLPKMGWLWVFLVSKGQYDDTSNIGLGNWIMVGLFGNWFSLGINGGMCSKVVKGGRPGEPKLETYICRYKGS